MKDILIAAVGNPVIIGVLLAILIVVIGMIVKKTKTQKDDQIYGMICNAFNIAEKIIPDKTGPIWMQKTDAALKTFIEEYKKREGKDPTEGVIQYAKDEWAIIANEMKKS